MCLHTSRTYLAPLLTTVASTGWARNSICSYCRFVLIRFFITFTVKPQKLEEVFLYSEWGQNPDEETLYSGPKIVQSQWHGLLLAFFLKILIGFAKLQVLLVARFWTGTCSHQGQGQEHCCCLPQSFRLDHSQFPSGHSLGFTLRPRSSSYKMNEWWNLSWK